VGKVTLILAGFFSLSFEAKTLGGAESAMNKEYRQREKAK